MKALHLAIPVALFTIFCAFMMYESNESWSIGLVIGLISLVTLFSLKDSIDWNYYQKHPPTLEPSVKVLLNQVPFYKQLSEEQKKKFELRLGLFFMSHEYKRQRMAREEEDNELDAPDDLKAISSIPAIILTFDQDKFLCPEIELIVFYNHPFPTPAYKMLHHSEFNKEDKVLIFSFPHLRKGVFEPFVYFDVGMYEWSRASHIKSSGADWNTFSSHYGITKAQAEASIGLTEPDIESVQKVFEVHRSYLSLLS